MITDYYDCTLHDSGPWTRTKKFWNPTTLHDYAEPWSQTKKFWSPRFESTRRIENWFDKLMKKSSWTPSSEVLPEESTIWTPFWNPYSGGLNHWMVPYKRAWNPNELSHHRPYPDDWWDAHHLLFYKKNSGYMYKKYIIYCIIFYFDSCSFSSCIWGTLE